MAFTGYDSVIAAKVAGKSRRINWNKTVVTGATSGVGAFIVHRPIEEIPRLEVAKKMPH